LTIDRPLENKIFIINFIGILSLGIGYQRKIDQYYQGPGGGN